MIGMHPERDPGDRPITRQERVTLALALCVITAVAAACSACAPSSVPAPSGVHYAVSPRAAPAPATRSPEQQTQGIALVQTMCPPDGDETEPSIFAGTALVVSAHRLVTAAHMVRCETSLGGFADPLVVMATLGRDAEPTLVTVGAVLADLDVAQLNTTADFSEDASPISVGPRPVVGDTACEAAAWPRWTYRCNMVEPGPSTGPILLDMKVEHGNSGSPLYVAGRLVGIVVSTLTCQDHTYCVARAAPLQGLDWLVE